MSLLNKRNMAERRLAALRENRKNSRGPLAADRERIRAANLTHGYHSKADTAALRALDEDPTDFPKLREGLRGKEIAPHILRERLAGRLARAFLRMDRADRMQDGYALRRAKEENCAREGRLHVQIEKKGPKNEAMSTELYETKRRKNRALGCLQMLFKTSSLGGLPVDLAEKNKLLGFSSVSGSTRRGVLAIREDRSGDG
jgi:hypothetical protein